MWTFNLDFLINKFLDKIIDFLNFIEKKNLTQMRIDLVTTLWSEDIHYKYWSTIVGEVFISYLRENIFY